MEKTQKSRGIRILIIKFEGEDSGFSSEENKAETNDEVSAKSKLGGKKRKSVKLDEGQISSPKLHPLPYFSITRPDLDGMEENYVTVSTAGWDPEEVSNRDSEKEKLSHLYSHLNSRQRYVLALMLDAEKSDKLKANMSLEELQKTVSNHEFQNGLLQEEDISITIQAGEEITIPNRDWGFIK